MEEHRKFFHVAASVHKCVNYGSARLRRPRLGSKTNRAESAGLRQTVRVLSFTARSEETRAEHDGKQRGRLICIVISQVRKTVFSACCQLLYFISLLKTLFILWIFESPDQRFLLTFTSLRVQTSGLKTSKIYNVFMIKKTTGR